MIKIPKFQIYGEGDSDIERTIQPMLALRQWVDLSDDEKKTALREMKNRGWVSPSAEILKTIEYLNHRFLRQCPGLRVHAIAPLWDDYNRPLNAAKRQDAAENDFEHILLNERSEALIFTMFSKFAGLLINKNNYEAAAESKNANERDAHISQAFGVFDLFAKGLNHILEQFAVNQLLTRNGFVPRQDDKITIEIYSPTMRVLADPKWKSVNFDLAKMFEDYREKNYPEVITKAHSVVQRFLQVLVGEEGKSGKGELGVLFTKAKQEGIIPDNRFTAPIIRVFEGFIPSERATNSTAKPALKEATSSDALLMMNVIMVFLQFCLQNTGK